MPRKISVLLIDPERQSIIKILATLPRHPVNEFRRIMRAKGTIGERKLMPMSPVAPHVAAQNDTEIGGATWRLRGGEDTCGRALIFGNAEPTKEREGGICSTPVDVAWLLDRIVWTPAESEERADERAAETLKLLDPDLRAAIAKAHVTPAGEIWLSADDHERFCESLQAHALVGDGVRKQRLNRVGSKIHALIEGASDASEG